MKNIFLNLQWMIRLISIDIYFNIVKVHKAITEKKTQITENKKYLDLFFIAFKMNILHLETENETFIIFLHCRSKFLILVSLWNRTTIMRTIFLNKWRFVYCDRWPICQWKSTETSFVVSWNQKLRYLNNGPLR